MMKKEIIDLVPLLDKAKIVTKDGFEIITENGEFFVIEKKTKYPKTFIECSSVIGKDAAFGISGHKGIPLYALQCLLICRDAFWKIASNWSPDWNNISDKYTIYPVSGEIWLDKGQTINTVLAFPTKEMRDTFYENFKDLIEQCKELL